MALPHTQAILNELLTLIQGLTLYTTVEIGAIKNWTNVDPLCEIMWIEDDSEHFKHGGGIRDPQGFRVLSAVSYTKAGITPPAAVAELIAIRDTVIPLFQQRSLLQGVTGVQDSRVKPGSIRISFVDDAGGDSFIVHEFTVEVRQTYFVPIGGPNA